MLVLETCLENMNLKRRKTSEPEEIEEVEEIENEWEAPALKGLSQAIAFKQAQTEEQ